MGRSGRLFLLLRPYTLLFVANLATTVLASVMDGVTFVLLVPFLRTLFGQQALPAATGSAVERILAAVAGPLLAAGAPAAALRSVALLLFGALLLKNALAFHAAVSEREVPRNLMRH